MARTMSVPCRRDLACYRNDGHPGECMYPTPDTVAQPAEPRAEGLRETVLGVLRYSVDEREHAEQIADDIVTALATPPQQAVPDPVPQFDGIPPDNCSYPSPRAVPEAASPTLREAAQAFLDHLDGKHVNNAAGCISPDHVPALRAALASQSTPAPLEVERNWHAQAGGHSTCIECGKEWPCPDAPPPYAQQDTPEPTGEPR